MKNRPTPEGAAPARATLLALVALVALLGLSACATGPVPAALAAGDRSATTMPPRAIAAAVAASSPAGWQAALRAGSGSVAAQANWSALNDPLLNRLLTAAQAASPTVSAAAARIERARATRVSAGAALLPTLSAVGTASSGRSIPKGPISSSAGVGVQAGWEIDLFGGAAAGRDAAQARLQAAEAGLAGARLAVAAETASGYVALRACEAQQVQTQRDAESRAETARLTELSARAGFTPPADAALARASAAQARNAVRSQTAACDTLVKALVEITDLAEPALRQALAAGTAQLPQPAVFSMAQVLPANLLSRRPDLAEAERAVLAAAGDRAQTQSRERPQLSLNGSLTAGAGRSVGITAAGAIWTFGPLQVSFPLFDGGARAAASAASRAEYDDAVAQYRALARRAVREVEESLVALQSASAREADALSAAKDFEVSLRATEARQKGGLASLFDLENARRSAVAAQSALIDLQRERAAAWIALVRALGGTWADGERTAVLAR